MENNIETLEIALMETIEELNSRTKRLDARIEETLSSVALAANDMKRLQVVNIETAMSGFRSIVIRHCMGKEDF